MFKLTPVDKEKEDIQMGDHFCKDRASSRPSSGPFLKGDMEMLKSIG